MDALKYITPKFFTTIKDYSKGQLHQGPDCRSYRGYHCPTLVDCPSDCLWC